MCHLFRNVFNIRKIEYDEIKAKITVLIGPIENVELEIFMDKTIGDEYKYNPK